MKLNEKEDSVMKKSKFVVSLAVLLSSFTTTAFAKKTSGGKSSSSKSSSSKSSSSKNKSTSKDSKSSTKDSSATTNKDTSNSNTSKTTDSTIKDTKSTTSNGTSSNKSTTNTGNNRSNTVINNYVTVKKTYKYEKNYIYSTPSGRTFQSSFWDNYWMYRALTHHNTVVVVDGDTERTINYGYSGIWKDILSLAFIIAIIVVLFKFIKKKKRALKRF